MTVTRLLNSTTAYIADFFFSSSQYMGEPLSRGILEKLCGGVLNYFSAYTIL